MNNASMSGSLCLMVALAALGAAGEGRGASLSEQDFLSEMPTVLSVSRLPQRLDETPGAVTLIDREAIRLSGARDLADLLRLVPGFQSSMSYSSLAPLASYHGAFSIFPNLMQVLVDGRSVYSPLFIGSVATSLQSVALADIERIEVLRGSNSAAYGARAFLGVVNIVTRDPADTHGAAVALAAGNNGLHDLQMRIGWGDVTANYRLHADRQADDGLAGANDRHGNNRVNFYANLQPAPGHELRLRAGRFSIGAGKGYPDNPDDALRDSLYTSDQAQLAWQMSLAPAADLLVQLSRVQESYSDTFAFSLLPLIPDSIDISLNGKAVSDALLVQHTFRQSPDLRVVWGAEWRREEVVSRPLFNTDQPLVTDFKRLFSNAEWRMVPGWVLNAGAMAEHSSETGSYLAPRLMLNWHLSKGQTLRAGASRAFRPPSAFEKQGDIRFFWKGIQLKATTVASGQVQAETNLVRELGYLGEFPAAGLSLDVRVFHEQIGNFIRRQRTTSTGGSFDYENYLNFPMVGAEYQLSWQPWQGAKLLLSQAYIDIRSTPESAMHSPPSGRDPLDVANSAAQAAPRLTNTLQWIQKLPGGLDLTLLHQNSGPRILPGATIRDLLPLARTDLRLGRVFQAAGRRTEVAMVVQNIGAPYADYVPRFQFERRAFLTLSTEY